MVHIAGIMGEVEEVFHGRENSTGAQQPFFDHAPELSSPAARDGVVLDQLQPGGRDAFGGADTVAQPYEAPATVWRTAWYRS